MNGDKKWSSYVKDLTPTPTPQAYTYFDSALSNGNETAYGTFDLGQAEEKCNAIPTCKGFTYKGAAPLQAGSVIPIWFKSSASMNGDKSWGAYIKGSASPTPPPALPTPAPPPPMPTPPTPAVQCKGCFVGSSGECKSPDDHVCYAKEGGTCPAGTAECT
jgi:hypothetical protein